MATFFLGALLAQNPITGNQGFQIITEGNFTSAGSHHIHGPFAVGGNLVINTAATSEVKYGQCGLLCISGRWKYHHWSARCGRCDLDNRKHERIEW